MEQSILQYKGGELSHVPETVWRQHVQAHAANKDRLSFMTAYDHAVRYFAVRELPRNNGKPLTPAQIAAGCSLPVDRVNAILDELEKRLFFLVRDHAGNVSWAFPVTAEPTPHALRFSTGENIFGA